MISAPDSDLQPPDPRDGLWIVAVAPDGQIIDVTLFGADRVGPPYDYVQDDYGYFGDHYFPK